MPFKFVVAGATTLIATGVAFYKRHSNKKKAPIVYLFGKVRVGKDTLLSILLKARFEKETKQTTKVHKEAAQKICGEWLKIWNTGGADLQNETNIEAKRELEKQIQNGVGVYYTYVFKVDDYFSDKKMAEQIKDDLESAKTYSRNNKGFELVIIGTHRDKADKYESKIDVLANELSQKYGGKCKIWDLTRACEQGKQVQKELVEFITQA